MSGPANEHKPGPEETYGFLLYLGLLIGGIGAAALWVLSRRGGDVSDYARYSAIGAVIAGIVFTYLSSQPKAEAIAWMRSGFTALTIAFIFRWAVGEPYRIPSESMEPTLDGNPAAFKGDRVWVNKWWYGWKWPFTNKRIFNWHAPQRWDIVVFNNVDPDAAHPVLVKRVVGLPGERINIRDGVIHVNGKEIPLGEGMPPVFYTSGGGSMRYGVRPEDEYSLVPPGHYLVCGDNSSNSRDGRYFGWLPSENIIGRVASIWWPLDHRRDFTGFTKTWWWRAFVGGLLVWVFVRLFVGRSYPAFAPDGKTIDHYWVSFFAFGLRIPFWGRFIYRWASPKRGDYVLYRIAGDGVPADTMIAARVAALPGETVTLDATSVRINGAPLPVDAWPSAAAYAAGKAAADVKPLSTDVELGGNEFYLLCDDPADTEPYDSRMLGPVSANAISGTLTRRWWPLARIGKV